MKAKILVVEDKADQQAELKLLLERSGFEVITADTGEQALNFISKARPDLVILDVGLPRMDGHEVLYQLREGKNLTPVIMLTKDNSQLGTITAFQKGADDYIDKPYDPLELIVRVQAILRRTQRGQLPLINCRYLISGDLTLDRQTRTLSLCGKEIKVIPRTFRLLEYLMLHSQEEISRERLLREVWGNENYHPRVVDQRIVELRKVLEEDPTNPRCIQTVSEGYRFIANVEGR
jgi:DNA-binding response OmpR family regulator